MPSERGCRRFFSLLAKRSRMRIHRVKKAINHRSDSVNCGRSQPETTAVHKFWSEEDPSGSEGLSRTSTEASSNDCGQVDRTPRGPEESYIIAGRGLFSEQTPCRLLRGSRRRDTAKRSCDDNSAIAQSISYKHLADSSSRRRDSVRRSCDDSSDIVQSLSYARLTIMAAAVADGTYC